MKKISSLLSLILVFQITLAQESSFQKDFSGTIQYNAEQVKSLAEAIPEGTFDWSPGDDVRSVKSVLLHIASANYFFGSKLGAQMPEGIDPQALEQQVKGKSNIMEAVQKSVDFVSKAAEGVSEQNMNEMVELFGGNKFSKRMIMMIALTHNSEHKGQLIAYARMNNITPPWSQQ